MEDGPDQALIGFRLRRIKMGNVIYSMSTAAFLLILFQLLKAYSC